MTFYDIIMLVLLLGAVIFGYWKGLAWQIASVAAVVVSYFAAYRFHYQVAPYVKAQPPFNEYAAMLIIFVACSLMIWLAYAYVNRSLEKAELDGFNRQMGALVGAVLGVLLCMVATMFAVSLLGPTAHDSIFTSKFGPYVVRGISMVRSIVPEEFAGPLDPHFNNFQQQIGHDLDLPNSSYPAYQNDSNSYAVPGGSQYGTGQVFNPNQQTSYQGNWNTTPANRQAQTEFPNNGSQPTYNPQTQPRYNYQPAASNQGTNYAPQQQYAPQPPQPTQTQQQPQSPGLPPINLKLDTETLLKGAGRWLQDSVTNPSGN